MPPGEWKPDSRRCGRRSGPARVYYRIATRSGRTGIGHRFASSASRVASSVGGARLTPARGMRSPGQDCRPIDMQSTDGGAVLFPRPIWWTRRSDICNCAAKRARTMVAGSICKARSARASPAEARRSDWPGRTAADGSVADARRMLSSVRRRRRSPRASRSSCAFPTTSFASKRMWSSTRWPARATGRSSSFSSPTVRASRCACSAVHPPRTRRASWPSG